MEENKGLLLKCAMSYGLAMGIYWVIKYLFLIFGYSIPSLIFMPCRSFHRLLPDQALPAGHRRKHQFLPCMAVRHHAVFLRGPDRFDRAFHILPVYRSARLPEQHDDSSHSSAEER